MVQQKRRYFRSNEQERNKWARHTVHAIYCLATSNALKESRPPGLNPLRGRSGGHHNTNHVKARQRKPRQCIACLSLCCLRSCLRQVCQSRAGGKASSRTSLFAKSTTLIICARSFASEWIGLRERRWSAPYLVPILLFIIALHSQTKLRAKRGIDKALATLRDATAIAR